MDRLTRSLSDFAKMVEIFDAHEVSFVAVTQQFNTTVPVFRDSLAQIDAARVANRNAGER